MVCVDEWMCVCKTGPVLTSYNINTQIKYQWWCLNWMLSRFFISAPTVCFHVKRENAPLLLIIETDDRASVGLVVALLSVGQLWNVLHLLTLFSVLRLDLNVVKKSPLYLFTKDKSTIKPRSCLQQNLWQNSISQITKHIISKHFT